jgi:hypothetical protein
VDVKKPPSGFSIVSTVNAASMGLLSQRQIVVKKKIPRTENFFEGPGARQAESEVASLKEINCL